MSAQITWSIPYNILQDDSYTTINIYKGKNENDDNFALLTNIDRWVNNDKTQEVDSYTDEYGNETYCYYVRYKKDNGALSKILLTTFELNLKR